MSEDKLNYDTKRNWEYSTDEQEALLANDVITKACIDQKKSLTPDDKKLWIKKLLTCAKANNLTLSSKYSMFYVSFFEDRVATLPSQVSRMLIGASGITYNIIFVHVNDKFSYFGIDKMTYEKVEYNSDYVLSYEEFMNDSKKMEIKKFTGVKNLLCVQLEVDLGTKKDYPSPLEVRDICRRASLSKMRTVKDSVWLKHFKAMVEKTVALKIAKDYKYFIDKVVTGYDKAIEDNGIEETSYSNQALTVDEFDPANHDEISQVEIDAINKQTVVEVKQAPPTAMIEKENLTAEQILGLCDRWSSEVPAIKVKALKMIEIGVIRRNPEGNLTVATDFMADGEAMARKIILQVWYASNEG